MYVTTALQPNYNCFSQSFTAGIISCNTEFYVASPQGTPWYSMGGIITPGVVSQQDSNSTTDHIDSGTESI